MVTGALELAARSVARARGSAQWPRRFGAALLWSSAQWFGARAWWFGAAVRGLEERSVNGSGAQRCASLLWSSSVVWSKGLVVWGSGKGSSGSWLGGLEQRAVVGSGAQRCASLQAGVSPFSFASCWRGVRRARSLCKSRCGCRRLRVRRIPGAAGTAGDRRAASILKSMTNAVMASCA